MAGTAATASELTHGLLNTYPRLPFVLIGNIGQQDPKIYRDIALAHPSASAPHTSVTSPAPAPAP